MGENQTSEIPDRRLPTGECDGRSRPTHGHIHDWSCAPPGVYGGQLSASSTAQADDARRGLPCAPWLGSGLFSRMPGAHEHTSSTVTSVYPNPSQSVFLVCGVWLSEPLAPSPVPRHSSTL